jgi:hypothetical protein
MYALIADDLSTQNEARARETATEEYAGTLGNNVYRETILL